MVLTQELQSTDIHYINSKDTRNSPHASGLNFIFLSLVSHTKNFGVLIQTEINNLTFLSYILLDKRLPISVVQMRLCTCRQEAHASFKILFTKTQATNKNVSYK